MNKGIKGVVAGIGIMLTFDVLTLMLRREIGFCAHWIDNLHPNVSHSTVERLYS